MNLSAFGSHTPAFIVQPVAPAALPTGNMGKVLDYMRRHGSISTREAYLNLNEMTSSDLRKYITRLRQRGFAVKSEQRTHETTGKRYSRYSLRG